MKRKEQFGWSCGYERIYGNFHPDNERCTCQSTKLYDTKEEAARAGLRHKAHPDSVGVYSTKTGYIGLAVGINFNSAKVIGRRNEDEMKKIRRKEEIKDVHTEHCCILHGCKYGKDDVCTVQKRLAPQSYTCETCDYYGITTLEMVRKIDKTPKKVKCCPHCNHLL